MAIELKKIIRILDGLDLNYDQRDEETLVLGNQEGEDKVFIIIKLLEDGEFLSMRTLKHLDDLVAEADEDKRTALLNWMLNQNYTRKLGQWEYDPEDHDHHISIGFPIEDGDLTEKQFMRMFTVIAKSVDSIKPMKAVLGLVDSAEDEKERKRQELLAQLAALDSEPAGI